MKVAKDLVVSLLQNFRPSAPDLQYLDRSIEQIEADVRIMLTPDKIISLRVDQTLHEGLQIINGGQTCKTIQRALAEHAAKDFSGASVLFRLYEVDASEEEFVAKITFATNNQSPIGIADLHSNDPVQERLGIGLK